MKYTGVIIEESLRDTTVLESLKIISTRIEPTTAEHKTPWLKQWTLHSVEIPKENAAKIAEDLSLVLDSNEDGNGNWYADYKNNNFHFIIFAHRVFRVNLSNPREYDEVKSYGISQGIPSYQLDFSPDI